MHRTKGTTTTTSLSDDEITLLRISHSLLTEKIKCKICNNSMKKVAGIQCGHVFCRPCIVKQLQKSSLCPLCNSEVDKNITIVNKSLTVYYENLQDIIKQCERLLPRQTPVATKKRGNEAMSVSETPPTTARRSKRSMACKTPAGEHSDADLSKQRKNEISATTVTKHFDMEKISNRKESKAELEELKSPLRMPSQFPNESSVVSQYSIIPEDKVRYWLDEAKTSAVPTQDKPIDTPITQSTLVSVSQTRAKHQQQQQTFKTPPVPQRTTEEPPAPAESEETQADSIIVSNATRRNYAAEAIKEDSILNLDISIEECPGLFKSQSDEYQNKREEKRLKDIEKCDNLEKPKLRGLGLRKKKVLPIKYDDEDDSEPKSNTPIKETRSRNSMSDVSIEDFIEDGVKEKPIRRYSNKKLNPPVKVQTDIDVATQQEVSPMKPGVLNKELPALPVKSSSIVEVASPEHSPLKKKKTPSPGFSRYQKMKSDFMEKRKILPLDISTGSTRNAPAAKKSVSPKSSEMVIDSASERTVAQMTVNQPLAEPAAKETNHVENHHSPNLIENSLPIEGLPEELQGSYSGNAAAPKKAERNKPRASKKLLPALSIPPTQESIQSSASATSVRKRKTFSLESNTADIVGNSPPGQKTLQTFAAKCKTPEKNATLKNRIQFFRQGKLHSARKMYSVQFFKLGYLSPITVKRNIKFVRKQFRDAAVQTSPRHASQMDTTLAEKSKLSSWDQSAKLPNPNKTTLSETVEAEKRVDDSSDEMDLVEKSQEMIENDIFLPQLTKAKDYVLEPCQIDSNDIIPASMPTVTQSLKRLIDSSSLSLSASTGSVETLLSLNESEFDLQQDRSEKPTKRRKLASRFSQENTQNSADVKRMLQKTAPNPVVDVVKGDGKELQWRDSSQDAAVRAVVMEDLKYAREKATQAHSLGTTCIIESTPNDKNVGDLKAGNINSQDAQPGKALNASRISAKGNNISPFLEESDSLTENEIEHQNSTALNNSNESFIKLSANEGKLVCKESVNEVEEEELEVIEGTPKAKRSEAVAKLDPAVSFIFTSLAKGQVAQIQKFCQTFKSSSVNTSMNQTVTHLVVPHSEDMNTVSTLKFYLAVAKGLWVVSIHWVSDCISSGRIIPEEPYEMKNMHGFDGPRKSRLSKGNIFHDFEMFCLDGIYTGVSREQIKDIIRCGGGLALKSIREPQKKKYRLVICASENVDEGAMEDSNCVVLMMDWVLESVENYRLASAFNYLPIGVSVTQVSQSHFDLPADMLRFEASDESM
ncbi:uncharacterized protein LOC135941317 [Cloeon dipterum]|uniref:uncharacterized protein LOC135941317 n=1 Tax=Cloeon dipterum TaxID=197152 RepID=UPI00321F8363